MLEYDRIDVSKEADGLSDFIVFDYWYFIKL